MSSICSGKVCNPNPLSSNLVRATLVDVRSVGRAVFRWSDSVGIVEVTGPARQIPTWNAAKWVVLRLPRTSSHPLGPIVRGQEMSHPARAANNSNSYNLDSNSTRTSTSCLPPAVFQLTNIDSPSTSHSNKLDLSSSPTQIIPLKRPSTYCNTEQQPLCLTLWEDEHTFVYQVKIGDSVVSRRADDNWVNGTKLVNMAGLTRGKRDTVLKLEPVKRIQKQGLSALKGVWIPLEAAHRLATTYSLLTKLHPLLSPPQEIESSLYTIQNLAKTASLVANCRSRERVVVRDRLEGRMGEFCAVVRPGEPQRIGRCQRFLTRVEKGVEEAKKGGRVGLVIRSESVREQDLQIEKDEETVVYGSAEMGGKGKSEKRKGKGKPWIHLISGEEQEGDEGKERRKSIMFSGISPATSTSAPPTFLAPSMSSLIPNPHLLHHHHQQRMNNTTSPAVFDSHVALDRRHSHPGAGAGVRCDGMAEAILSPDQPAGARRLSTIVPHTNCSPANGIFFGTSTQMGFDTPHQHETPTRRELGGRLPHGFAPVSFLAPTPSGSSTTTSYLEHQHSPGMEMELFGNTGSGLPSSDPSIYSTPETTPDFVHAQASLGIDSSSHYHPNSSSFGDGNARHEFQRFKFYENQIPSFPQSELEAGIGTGGSERMMDVDSVLPDNTRTATATNFHPSWISPPGPGRGPSHPSPPPTPAPPFPYTYSSGQGGGRRKSIIDIFGPPVSPEPVSKEGQDRRMREREERREMLRKRLLEEG